MKTEKAGYYARLPLSPPYTSTQHPSSSIFCCYIIATITSTSTPQSPSSSLLTFSLSPQALSVSLTPPFCLSLYHSDLPIHTSSSLLLLLSIFFLTSPLHSPVLFVAVSQRPSYPHLFLLSPRKLPPILLHLAPSKAQKKSRTDFSVYPGL